MQPSKSVCVLTNGCPSNRVDGARITEFLKRNHYRITECASEADVILFNACGLTDREEDAAREIITRLKALKKPHARLVVGGCLVKINNTFGNGDTFGVDEGLDVLDRLFAAHVSIRDIHANHMFPKTGSYKDLHAGRGPVTRAIKRLLSRDGASRSCGILPAETGEGNLLARLGLARGRYTGRVAALDRKTYLIQVSTGCLNACSFCGVRLSRGRLKSKPLDRIEQEFREGLEKGFREFGLIGTDVGCYGRDYGTDLVCLLRKLVKAEGQCRIKIWNFQPRFLIEMLPDLREILDTSNVSHIWSAAESGNNRILKLMNRGYRIEDFKDAVRILNADYPELRLRTQLIVGFPGETEDEFQDTMALLREVKFEYVGVYIFRPRHGTRAAEMDGRVPEDVAVRRCQELCAAFDNVIPGF